MAWRGSFSRSFNSKARASTFRSSPPFSSARRVRPPSLQPRRFCFSNPREEWKRWVMSAALSVKQWQDSDTELNLNVLLDQHNEYLKIGSPRKVFPAGTLEK